MLCLIRLALIIVISTSIAAGQESPRDKILKELEELAALCRTQGVTFRVTQCSERVKRLEATWRIIVSSGYDETEGINFVVGEIEQIKQEYGSEIPTR